MRVSVDARRAVAATARDMQGDRADNWLFRAADAARERNFTPPLMLLGGRRLRGFEELRDVRCARRCLRECSSEVSFR